MILGTVHLNAHRSQLPDGLLDQVQNARDGEVVELLLRVVVTQWTRVGDEVTIRGLCSSAAHRTCRAEPATR